MSTRHDEHEAAAAAAADWAAQDFSKATIPTEAERRRLLAQLPPLDPNTPVMVSRSLRLPTEMELEIKAAAETEGISASEWIRRALRQAIAGTDSRQISLAAAIEALERLPRAI
jgi:Arc/MetJ-type ribon-helix-helix transcriptional regulator